MTRNDPNQLRKEKSTRRSIGAATRWPIVFGIIIVLSVVYAVSEGMQARVQAKTRLHQMAVNSAIPFVNVVYPTRGVGAEQIELPGNTQAFTDTPIYARTSGYVKRWYVDIGAHVEQGQLLAEIETPELDQQLRQAKVQPEGMPRRICRSRTLPRRAGRIC